MPFYTTISSYFLGSSSNVNLPTNFIHNFQITSTKRVNGIVTAQNIQKLEDTLTGLVEEKSNIDMLNTDYYSH